jgi:hypothetical protein
MYDRFGERQIQIGQRTDHMRIHAGSRYPAGLAERTHGQRRVGSGMRAGLDEAPSRRCHARSLCKRAHYGRMNSAYQNTAMTTGYPITVNGALARNRRSALRVETTSTAVRPSVESARRRRIVAGGAGPSSSYEPDPLLDFDPSLRVIGSDGTVLESQCWSSSESETRQNAPWVSPARYSTEVQQPPGPASNAAT